MKRKTFSKDFKAKVAIAAVKGQQTTNEIASEFEVHVTQVNSWKKQLIANASKLFSRGSDKQQADHEQEAGKLYEQIGRLKMVVYLNRQGHPVNRKRIQRLMRKMGIQSVAPKPNTSRARKGHKVYPYLLSGLTISRPHQVWSTDITYIRLVHGFVYLAAVIDLYTRQVLSWEVSVTMEDSFCVSVLERALRLYPRPEIFNTDQGVQFTGKAFTDVLKSHEIKISMDGKGRALDNIFIERLWRSVKYEEIYLHEYQDVTHLKRALRKYFHFYNTERPHQSLDYQTPVEFDLAETTEGSPAAVSL